MVGQERVFICTLSQVTVVSVGGKEFWICKYTAGTEQELCIGSAQQPGGVAELALEESRCSQSYPRWS